jgi:hypothetical protein
MSISLSAYVASDASGGSYGIGGSISPQNTTGTLTLALNSSITFTITPNAGYQRLKSYVRINDVVYPLSNNATLDVRFGNYYDGGPTNISVNSSFIANISDNSSIGIWTVFEKLSLQVDIAIVGIGGTVSPSGIQTVAGGSDLSITWTPSTNYLRDKILVDGVAYFTSPISLNNITSNKTVRVYFTSVYAFITASAGSNGTISPSGISSVLKGTNQVFTITPNSGYQIDTVLIDGTVVIGVSGSYQFSNVQGNHTIDVTFKVAATKVRTVTCVNGSVTLVKYYVTGQGYLTTPLIQDANGAYTQVCVPLETPQLQITTVGNAEQVFYEEIIDGENIGNGSIGYGAESLVSELSLTTCQSSVQFTYGPAYGTVTVTQAANGSIIPAGVNKIYDWSYDWARSSLQLNFAANSGYVVDKILKNGAVVSSPGTVTATYNYPNLNYTSSTQVGKPSNLADTITASFTKGVYAIVSSAGANGTISPLGTSQVNKGASKTFTFTPSSLYGVASVLVDGANVGVMNSYTFSNVSADHTISVTFVDISRTIVASSGPNGTISPAGNVTVTIGSSKTFTMIPNSGYGVENVIVDGVSIGSVTSYTFSNLTSGHTISVTFTDISRIITASAGANGSINPGGSIGVTIGGTKSFSITPNVGYQVDQVLVDGASVGAVTSYNFTNIQADHTIEASFKVLDSYFITASAGSNGTISPSGSVAAVKGTNKSFTIAPNSNCEIVDVLVDGVSQGKITAYTFTNVQENHSISATFSKNSYKIIATHGLHGVVLPSGEISVEYGANQTFNIIPDEDYVIQDIIVDGVSKDMPLSGILFIID